ncbi:MAG: TrkH family potassium uptake protein, partial [Pseudomonadota bacterium]
MLAKFHLVPLLGLMMSLAMVLPAAFAVQTGFREGAEAFLFAGLLGAILTVMVGLGTMRSPQQPSLRGQLAGVILSLLVLPAVLAVPVGLLVPSISNVQAYFEMLSALTTTGATVFTDPQSIPPVVHLWRALVGWFGGALILMTAIAILEPLHLGGFEIEATVTGNRRPQMHRALSSNRRSLLVGQMGVVLPAYASLTGLLAMCLIFAGDPPFVALCHALSVMSTSGITPLDGLADAPSAYWGEGVIFVFLIFAVSRRWLVDLPRRLSFDGIWPDPELKLALICLAVLPLVLFGRHFVSAVEVEVQEDFIGALRAYWGGLFTVGAFLTTFGLESRDWEAAQDWSGLPNSSIILLGL